MLTYNRCLSTTVDKVDYFGTKNDKRLIMGVICKEGVRGGGGTIGLYKYLVQLTARSL